MACSEHARGPALPATTGRFVSRPHPACLLPPRRVWSASWDTGRDRARSTGKRATSRPARDGLSEPESGARLPGQRRRDGTNVRVQLLTNAGAPEQDNQLPVKHQHRARPGPGLLTYLTHKGVFTDGGRFTDLQEDLRQQVFAAYPQPAGDSSIRDAIIAHAKRSKAAAPPFSIAAELLRGARASKTATWPKLPNLPRCVQQPSTARESPGFAQVAARAPRSASWPTASVLRRACNSHAMPTSHQGWRCRPHERKGSLTGRLRPLFVVPQESGDSGGGVEADAYTPTTSADAQA
jgi:hypothetical protein